jgi:hypothetical protein
VRTGHRIADLDESPAEKRVEQDDKEQDDKEQGHERRERRPTAAASGHYIFDANGNYIGTR